MGAHHDEVGSALAPNVNDRASWTAIGDFG
jgi:hypothetical protein